MPDVFCHAVCRPNCTCCCCVLILPQIDIEGWEYPILAEFKYDDPLPREIAIELHVTNNVNDGNQPNSLTSMAMVFLHLANLGYGAYSQEVNPIDPACCSEFSFMRFKV